MTPHHKYNEINKVTWRTKFWKWRRYKWIQLKNWWFFFKRMGQKQCRIKYMHDFPDFPCKICSPDAYKQSEKARKWRKEQRELVGDIFEDKKNFDI